MLKPWIYLKLELFPTWVGVIPGYIGIHEKADSFPHMGGGDPFWEEINEAVITFSPHGWG